MNPTLPRRFAILGMACLPALAVSQESAPAQKSANTVLPPVVVSATRVEQASFDLPVSISQVEGPMIQHAQPMVNLSESLVRLPGVVAQNRYNYAQDLQISSRGFGSRATFGVRGLRLYADGIPATMPDGQGQVSHFDLGSAERIEVLRGPFSALYGNSSGGVISVFTENGKPGLRTEGDAQFGSDHSWRLGLKSSGEQGMLNHVVSASRFSTDGFRPHSAATRNTGNAKLKIQVDEDSRLTLVGNAVKIDAQDPLGLTRDAFDNDPDSTVVNALNFNTRKSVDQQQLGLTFERAINRDSQLHAMVYAGQRDTVQFQSIPVFVQTPPTQSGGVIDLARRYWGADLRWTQRATLAGKPLRWTAGVNYDRLDEDRLGYENFVGTTLGVRGNLRRDEDNRIHNFDQYLQAQWEPGARWLLLAGVRHSAVTMRSADRFVTAGNGDDSGSVRYESTNPTLGATYRLTDAVNLYGAVGKGFETPTFNEISYRSVLGTTTGLNFALSPAGSRHAEVGIKAHLGNNMLADLAVFHVDTRNELTVLENAGGRSVYQNAGKTQRDGMELQLRGDWANGLHATMAYSWLRAVYDEAFCSGACGPDTLVAKGNRLPGVPAHHWFGELGWRHAQSGFNTALEARYAAKVYVNDINSDAAPSYFVTNLRLGFEQTVGRWRLREFFRIDNLADRRYAGSVIVNEGNRRYFEPAPGRTYLAGISAAYQW